MAFVKSLRNILRLIWFEYTGVSSVAWSMGSLKYELDTKSPMFLARVRHRIGCAGNTFLREGL